MEEERTEQELRQALGRFFHREVDRRYDPERMEGLPEVAERGLLDGVSEEDLERVKTFFKRVMYPVGGERRHQERHMEAVTEILSSSSSVISMLPRLPGLIMRHGTRIAGVSRAGLQVITAYQRARKVEERVIDAAFELDDDDLEEAGENDDPPDELFRRAYACVEEHEIREMVRLTDKIVRLGADRRLMAATLEVVESLRDQCDDPSDAAALDYVRSVALDVQELSRQFSRGEIDQILELAGAVELHYFRRLRAAARPG